MRSRGSRPRLSASVGSGKSWPALRRRWQRLSGTWTRPANGWQPSRRCVQLASGCATSGYLRSATRSRSLRSGGRWSGLMMLRARWSAPSPAASSWTRLLAATTSRLGGSSRVRSRPMIRSCASCSGHGVSLSTSDARKYSSSPRISWLSRCSGLRRRSSGLSRPPKRPSSSSATCPPGRPRTDTAATRGRRRGRRRSRRAGGDAYGGSSAPTCSEGMKRPAGSGRVCRRRFRD